MGNLESLWLLFIPVGVVAVIVAIVVTPLLSRIQALERRLDLLTNEVRAAEPRVEPAAEATPQPAAESVAPIPSTATPKPSVDTERAAEPAAVAPPPTSSDGFNWEESFATRWLIWIGGLALALGGAFLVKYTIDRDLLGPAVRVALGVVMGLALIGGGEWLRRTPFERALAAVSPSYAPPALVAAGAATLFTSIYAAYGVYEMMPALIAFVLLAAVAALAIVLSLLHGPFMALLGIAGGFVTPFLVSTGGHAAEALFPYLVVLIAGNLVVVRYMGWWWLAWVTLAGAAIWPLIWFPTAWEAVDVYIIGPYLLITGALFVLVRHIWGPPASDVEGVRTPAEPVAWSALAVVAALLFVLVRVDQYGPPSVVMMAAAGAGTILLARREPVFEGNVIVMAAVTVLTVAVWRLPQIIGEHVTLYDSFGQALGTVPVMPPEVNAFLVTAAIFAALFGLGGFLALWGARRPALHAVLSTATPLVLFTIAYWRIEAFHLDLAWTVAALVIAVLLAGATRQTLRYLAVAGMTGAVGSYTVGVVAALALAVTTALENAWLTVALAALLPAIAWIEGKLELPTLRHTALVLAAVVLVRLALNPAILDYPAGITPGLSWLLYGYGLPAAAFYAAARIFRKREDDITIAVLEVGALIFFVLLVTFEARDLASGGSPFGWPYTFDERAIHATTWLAIAYGLYHTHGQDGRAVAVWGWRILGGMATVLVAAWQILFDSPLASNDPVGDWPVLNLMALAYGGPFVFSMLFLVRSRRFGHIPVMRIASAMLVVTSAFWLTLEIRHVFHGSQLAHGFTSDAEWYAYSLAWLCYASILLAVSIWRGVDVLRHASLAIFMLTVAKVFLYDMAGLTGIYRVLSFIGLGLALVAVGYFYRRFVFPSHEPASEDPLPSD